MSTTSVLISLFFMMLAGVAAGKLKLFNEDARTVLSRFVFYIATTALIFEAILSLKIADLGKLPSFITTNAIIYAVLFFVVYLTLRSLKIPYRSGASILYSSTTANTIYLGLPLIRALYGSEGILYAVALLTIPSAVADFLDFYFLNRWRDGSAPMGKVIKILF
jgi:predicted permease